MLKRHATGLGLFLLVHVFHRMKLADDGKHQHGCLNHMLWAVGSCSMTMVDFLVVLLSLQEKLG